GRDAALEAEHLPPVGALVDDDDLETAVEIRELAPLGTQLAEHVFKDVLEDLGICVKRGLGALALAGLRGSGLLELAGRDAARGLLVIDLAAAAALELEPGAERVDRRDTDAVQAAGDLVARAAELAAGVEHGHHDLGGGAALLRHDVDRDAAAVVLDGDRVVEVDHDLDPVAVT